MKKIISALILGCVLTSLGCKAASDYTITHGFGTFYYKLQSDESGNTASIIGEHRGDPKYGGYLVEVDVPSVILIRNETSGLFEKYLINAIENLALSGEEDLLGYHGLSSYWDTETIRLPESVKTVGELSMCDLSDCDKVEMPGVQTIGKGGLSNDSAIKEPIAVRKLEYVGERAFAKCKKLPEILFGPNLRFVGKDAFEGCESLKTIDIWNPNTWSRVEFETASANPISVAKNFNSYGTKVHHLDIDANEKSISAYSFNSAENLRSVRIINASYIGESAFDKCMNLTDICLDVDSIGYYAFANTESIRKVYVMRENPPKAHASAFFDYNNAKLYVPKGSLEAYRNSEYCWRFFLNIEESDFSEVDDIFMADYDTENPASVEKVEREEREADNAIDPTKPLEVYTMQGQLISRSVKGLTPGLYILRQGRKAKKVVIGHP